MPSAPVQINDLAVTNTQAIAAAIKVYPNPATSLIHIDAAVKVSAVILGMDGKIAIQTSDVQTIDISNLGSGIYLLQIFDENHNLLKTDKLVKSGF